MARYFDWEYCECGCHGSELYIAGLYFWSLVEFPIQGNYNVVKIHLKNKHKWGDQLGTFDSYEALDQFIVDNYLKGRVEELEKELKKLKKILGKP